MTAWLSQETVEVLQAALLWVLFFTAMAIQGWRKPYGFCGLFLIGAFVAFGREPPEWLRRPWIGD